MVLIHVVPIALIFSFAIFVAIKLDASDRNRIYNIAVDTKPDNSKFEGRIDLYELADKFEGVEVSLLSRSEIKNKKPSSIWRWNTMDYWLENNHTENREYYVFTRPINK